MSKNDDKNLIEKVESTRAALRAAAKQEKNKVVDAVKSVAARNNKSANSKVSSDRLELLITVDNRQKSDYYQDI